MEYDLVFTRIWRVRLEGTYFRSSLESRRSLILTTPMSLFQELRAEVQIQEIAQNINPLNYAHHLDEQAISHEQQVSPT